MRALSAACFFAASCAGPRAHPTGPARAAAPPGECVPPPEPPVTDAPAIPALAPSRVRLTLEVPKRRIQEEIRSALPPEASGTQSGSAFFARWEAEWRVRPRGLPQISISDGRLTASLQADLSIHGRFAGTVTSCETTVNVEVRGRLR